MGLFKKKNKEKKPFKETGFGKFLHNAADKVPSLAGDILEIATSGNPVAKSLEIVKEKLDARSGVTDDPQEKVAINNLLLEMEKNKQDWVAEMYRTEVDDRKSARQLQMKALDQDDKFARRYIYYLATFIIVSATIFGVMFFFVDVPERNMRLVEMFADIYLFAGAIMVIQFYFGSSMGSKTKDNQPNPPSDVQ
jgi:hypothetical protein